MNKNVLRQWALLRILPRYPKKIAATDLLDSLDRIGFETTIRTVQRDLNSLALSFPIVSDDAKPQGWSWAKDAPQLNLPDYDQQTAVNFLVARSHLDKIFPKNSLSYLKPWFKAADEALNILGVSTGQLNNKIRIESRSFSLRPPEMNPEVLDSVYDALLREKCLQLTYASRSKEKSEEYVVHPLSVVIIDAVSYLVVIFEGHEDIRHLAVHRIRKIILLDQSRKIPEDFNLDEYVANGSFGMKQGSIDLHLKFRLKTMWAKHLEETPMTSDQRITHLPDGWTQIEATVPDTSQIRWWLRGFGADLIIDGPKRLLNEFIRESELMRKNYSPD
jgi:predicted DNA-binding transcriptional regulator YafY